MRLPCSIIIVLLAVLFSVQGGFTTTLFEKDAACPVCSADVKIHVIGSHGGYIYNWPSKYDLIYWPYTDSHWFFACPSCCYTQLGDDFVDLDEADIPAVETALAGQYNHPYMSDDAYAILERALLVNRALDRPPEFWLKFDRILAYLYRRMMRPDLAIPFEQDLVDRLDRGSYGNLTYCQRHYLLGEYNRRLGHTAKARWHLLVASYFRLVFYGIPALLLAAAFLTLVRQKKMWSPRARLGLLLLLVTLSILLAWSVCSSWDESTYIADIAAERLALIEK